MIFASTQSKSSRSRIVPLSRSEIVAPSTFPYPYTVASALFPIANNVSIASYMFPETIYPQSSILFPETVSMQGNANLTSTIKLASLAAHNPAPQVAQGLSPPTQVSGNVAPPPAAGNDTTPNLATQLRNLADKSLKRMAPVELTAEGRPILTIPDDVFSHGVEQHQDFVVGHFLGRLPTKGQIQSVINYLWGQGKQLELHHNPLARSTLFRIPNEVIRAKVLKQRIWYIGTSMFQVSKWSDSLNVLSPILKRVPTWAHVKGVPFDLITQKGLSYVAGLIGEPVETDDYTKNLTSLNIAHLKVEADVTKHMPHVVEIRRTSGEIIPVEVEDPRLPPSCSECKEIGHIFRNCLKVNLAWVPKPKPDTTTSSQPASTPAGKTTTTPAVSNLKVINTTSHPLLSGPSTAGSDASPFVSHISTPVSGSTLMVSSSVAPLTPLVQHGLPL